jgi:hypothetical protein
MHRPRERNLDTQWHLNVEYHQSKGKPPASTHQPDRREDIEVSQSDRETAEKVRNEHILGQKKR